MKASISAERLAYSPTEATQLIGVSEQWIYDRINAGEIRTVKCHGRRLVPRSALLAFLGDTA